MYGRRRSLSALWLTHRNRRLLAVYCQGGIVALRAHLNFLHHFNVMLPVQSPLKKHSPSLLTQITGLFRAVSPHTEGRIMIVTNAGWDAVDAAASGA
jgi:hypothetical protein